MASTSFGRLLLFQDVVPVLVSTEYNIHISWAQHRRQLEMVLGDITPDTIVQTMLHGEGAVSHCCLDTLRKKNGNLDR